MGSQVPVTDRILGTIKHTHGCDLEKLAESLPELTWNQVFLEIDRLSRLGEIMVTFGTGGRYMIQLPDHKKGQKTHHVRP
jgi:predicted  nucleic acid-binding Zn-ribbon protein